MNVLHMAVKYNTGSDSSRTVVVPRNIYPQVIKQKDLVSNPIVTILNQVSDLNFNKDLPFYLNTSAIKVNGKVDQKSLKTVISNSSASGFNVKLTVSLPEISVSGDKIEVCEDAVKEYDRELRKLVAVGCGKGLKASLTAVKIKTMKVPVKLSITLAIKLKNNVASVKVVSVSSNLGVASGPKLDINFNELILPRISVIANGQETIFNTSQLKSQIIERKVFLGNKILDFVGDFIAEDLAEMINKYLVGVKVNTSIDIYNQKNLNRAEDNSEDEDDSHLSQSYSRPVINWSSLRNTTSQSTSVYKDHLTLQADKTYVAPVNIIGANACPIKTGPAVNIGQILEDQLSSIIKNAKIALSLKNLSTPLNKDIQLSGLLTMILNGERIQVQNRLGNRPVSALPVLNLAPHRLHDINLAISEPVINGVLDLANSTGLFGEIFDKIAKTQGASLKSVQVHFAKDKTIRAIANLEIDLNKIKSNGISSWIQNQIAVFLERNNNNGKIYFPLEITLVPTLIQKNGSAALNLLVKSPFNDDGIINTFGYPTNIEQMKKIVKEGVLKQLKDALCGLTDKAYTLDLKKFLNQSGVEFNPKTITFEQGAYMLVNMDIKNIKLRIETPKKK